MFLDKVKQVFTYKDLRKKIFYTVFIVLIFRLVTHIPVPGVDLEALKSFFSRSQLFGLFDIFSGGAMSQFSIAMMGVAPYISASIIMQLLSMIIPALEALSKEGERGQHIINQYTRYLTVPLAVLEAFGLITLLSRSELGIITALSVSKMATMIITVTAGTIFLMWLGELITENGIGNGISLIIFLGIVSRGPAIAQQIIVWADSPQKILNLVGFGILAFLVVLGIVFIENAQRRIPVAYAKRVRGMRMYGGVSTYLPLKVNQAGVIPIIFAMSFIIFPGVVANFLKHVQISWLAKISNWVANHFTPESLVYGVLYFVLVFAFTYFYTSIVFNPKNISENLQKQGGFIPGIRPGYPTEEYLSKISNRVTFAGALFLGIIAIMPFLVQRVYPSLQLTLGGTAILIVVSVILETAKQIEAQIMMRSYDYY